MSLSQLPQAADGRTNGAAADTHSDVLIIGTGMGGLCAAIKLQQRGVTSMRLLERAEEVGGTWHANRYPGIAVDTSILQYSLSFEPNPGWTRLFASGPELRAYLVGLTEKYRLRDRIRFRTEVTEMRYLEADARWEVATSTGEVFTADVVVNATGVLSRPAAPNIPGLADFTGTVLHSGEWDESFSSAGRRVAAVGTGASAAQLVPEVAKDAAAVHVYQRSAPWVFPRDDREITEREHRIWRRFPLVLKYQRLRRFLANDRVAIGFERQDKTIESQRQAALAFIERQIADPELRRKVVPDYNVGCKRRVQSDDWYPTLQRPNVELITSAVTRVTPTSVVGADGSEREVDTIIFSTGFAIGDFLPMKVFGRGGVELHETWTDGAATHLGITVAGFPNLFIIGGPNSAIGAGSFAFMIEAQVRYMVSAVEFLRRTGTAAVEVKLEVQRRSYWKVQARLAGSVYGSGCVGWYQAENGHIDTLWPGSNAEYAWRTRRFDAHNYQQLSRRPDRELAGAGTADR